MGEVTFRGLRLAAAPGRVMTPRPATEALVDAALELVGDRPAVVADVGTGSGAIAVAIAHAAPRVTVWATETSPAAVALARANVRRHGLGARVTVRQGDLLDQVPGELDVVVANLPYLPLSDAAEHPELDAEPADAVFAPGDGLDPYRRLIAACRHRLAPDGALLIQLHREVRTATAAELRSRRIEYRGAADLGSAAGEPTSADAVRQRPARERDLTV
jgi:release factor glutamine methyltransferase